MAEGKKQYSMFEILVGIASVIGAIAFLVKIFGKSDEEKVEKEAKESREDTYKDLSYPAFRYKDWADQLDTALMEGATEDEETVYNVFRKMKTMGDINKLIDAFGDHRQMLTLSWITLPQAISTYMSKSEIKKLNGIISDNGIDYTFE